MFLLTFLAAGACLSWGLQSHSCKSVLTRQHIWITDSRISYTGSIG